MHKKYLNKKKSHRGNPRDACKRGKYNLAARNVIIPKTYKFSFVHQVNPGDACRQEKHSLAARRNIILER